MVWAPRKPPRILKVLYDNWKQPVFRVPTHKYSGCARYVVVVVVGMDGWMKGTLMFKQINLFLLDLVYTIISIGGTNSMTRK